MAGRNVTPRWWSYNPTMFRYELTVYRRSDWTASHSWISEHMLAQAPEGDADDLFYMMEQRALRIVMGHAAHSDPRSEKHDLTKP